VVKPSAVRLPWGLLVLLALMSAGIARGQMYSWVDGNGDMHFTDDISQVPPDQRPAEKAGPEERSRIQVVPMSPPKRRPPGAPATGNPRAATPPPWASNDRQPATSTPAPTSRAAPPTAANGSRSRAHWEAEFREVHEGLRKVEQCRSAIQANCSLTRCASGCLSEWENSSCQGGWVIPGACAQAFDIPGQRVNPRWSGGRSLENFSCEPLHAAADEAQRIWQERLDLLEAEARSAEVPQNWRSD